MSCTGPPVSRKSEGNICVAKQKNTTRTSASSLFIFNARTSLRPQPWKRKSQWAVSVNAIGKFEFPTGGNRGVQTMPPGTKPTPPENTYENPASLTSAGASDETQTRDRRGGLKLDANRGRDAA